jgi:hypothetical protein
VTRVEWRRSASFERFARALDVPSENIVAVIPRGGHDEGELWHVFFTTPQTKEGDALDVLLGPVTEGLHPPGSLEERTSRRILVDFFDELTQDLDNRYRTRDRG